MKCLHKETGIDYCLMVVCDSRGKLEKPKPSQSGLLINTRTSEAVNQTGDWGEVLTNITGNDGLSPAAWAE